MTEISLDRIDRDGARFEQRKAARERSAILAALPPLWGRISRREEDVPRDELDSRRAQLNDGFDDYYRRIISNPGLRTIHSIVDADERFQELQREYFTAAAASRVAEETDQMNAAYERLMADEDSPLYLLSTDGEDVSSTDKQAIVDAVAKKAIDSSPLPPLTDEDFLTDEGRTVHEVSDLMGGRLLQLTLFRLSDLNTLILRQIG